MSSRPHQGSPADEVLASRVPRGPEARLRAWIEAISSGDAAEAEAAQEGLVSLGGRAVRPLLRCLERDDDRTRLRAIGLLGLLGDPRAAEPLAALLHDSSEKIRRSAATALGRIASPLVVPTLAALLRRETAPRVRLAATRALVRLVQAGHEEALPPALERLADRREEPRVRMAAMEAIPWAPGEELSREGRSLLERLARERRGPVPRKARRMLASAPRPRLDPWVLERLLDDLGSRRLATWRQAVAQLRRAGSAVVEPLVQAMLDRPGDREYARRVVLVLRSLSSRQLGRLGPYLDLVRDPVHLAALVEVVEEAGSRALLARLAGFVGRLARLREEVPADEARALDRVRHRAHLALARAGSRLGIADLRRILEDTAQPLAPEIAEAIGLIGTRGDLPAMLRAYRRARGMTRLALRDAVLQVARRERVRRTGRFLDSLELAERRAAREILGAPRPTARRRGGRTPLVDSPEPPLLP